MLSLIVGLGYAGVSAYWASGGRGLLDTVGGVFEQLGRSRSAVTVAGLWVVVVVKVVAAALPEATLCWPSRLGWWRSTRALAWIDVAVLTLYGLVLSAGDLLSISGVIGAGAPKDRVALAWHGFLWDPWFFAWGALGAAALVCDHRRSRPGTA